MEKIIRAITILKKGGTIVYPTETSYGLGCDSLNKKAISKIFKIKKRPKSKNLTYIISSLDMAKKYGILTKDDIKLVKSFMPGPLTLVVKTNNKYQKIIGKEFAFRISSSSIARNLAKKLGRPIVSTSANLSGHPDIYNIKKIEIKPDFIIDSGKLIKRKPSTIMDLFDGINIRRQGPIYKKQIEKVLQR